MAFLYPLCLAASLLPSQRGCISVANIFPFEKKKNQNTKQNIFGSFMLRNVVNIKVLSWQLAGCDEQLNKNIWTQNILSDIISFQYFLERFYEDKSNFLWSIICFCFKSNWIQNYATEILLSDSSQTLARISLPVTNFQWDKKIQWSKNKALYLTTEYNKLSINKIKQAPLWRKILKAYFECNDWHFFAPRFSLLPVEFSRAEHTVACLMMCHSFID